MKRAIYAALIVIVVVVAWRVHGAASRPAAKVAVPIAAVTHGTLVVTLPVNGTLESAMEVPVRSEIAGNLIEVCPDNTVVKLGDFVYQLDTKDLEDQRDQLERALTKAQDALNNERADDQVVIAQAQSDADSAQEALKLAQDKAQADREKIAAQVKYAEGQLARAERELTRARRLAQMNYIAGTKLRDAENVYNRQRFDLEQQRAQQDDVDKRTAEQVREARVACDLALHRLDTAKANYQSGVGNAQVGVTEARRKLADVDQKITRCKVSAPAAGMAVIAMNTDNWPERRPYRLGDLVQSGASPITIYDFTKMQVRCQIGEMDISRVHQGQAAYVTSAAESGRRYRAKVASVEELAQESNVWQGGTPGKRVFGVLVALAETDPRRLRPGMTVDLEIVLDSVRDAMMAPIRAVFRDQGRSVVYAQRGDGFRRVPVKLGARNDLLIEVQGDLRVGDRVALERPAADVAGHAEGAR